MTLKYLNTFSMDVSAYYVFRIYTEEHLLTVWNRVVQAGFHVLILGEGSNVLFLEDYNGVVLLIRIKGIIVREDKFYWYLHVYAGELWRELVLYSLENNIPGLENLALIPGYVGAAPIQNIGAYGAELQKFCEYVDVLNLDVKEKIRLMADECQFGYRHSIFRTQFGFNYVIVAVGLRLNKYWQPILNYDGLDKFDVNHVTPREIFNSVCIMRKNKLPDPVVFGNAGSFFKNPIVDSRLINDLLNYYPDMPFYTYKKNLVKLSARWLIEHCSHLYNHQFGNAAIYKQQYLILINLHQKATADEIISLAVSIHSTVMDYFHICLEPEVRFFGSFGEIDGIRLLSTGNKQFWNIIM